MLRSKRAQHRQQLATVLGKQPTFRTHFVFNDIFVLKRGMNKQKKSRAGEKEEND